MSATLISMANYILAIVDPRLKIKKLRDGSEERRGERSQETKKEEDAKNKAAKTDVSGEIETHKEENAPRDLIHVAQGKVFDHQSGQLKSTKINQPAEKSAPDIDKDQWIIKSQKMTDNT